MEHNQGKQGNKQGLSRKALKVIFAVCLAGALAGGAYLVSTGLEIFHEQQRVEQTTVPDSPSEAADSSSSSQAEPEPEPELPDNPIDFASLQKGNSDIFAWLTVPDTNVNYPVLQHPSDNTFYLNHNEEGEESQSGSVFCELYNDNDMKDPVTIFYGHNGYGDTYFTTLHNLRDETFFDEHPEFYIYTPGHMFTYTIASVFVTDDRHLFSVYNFSKDEDLLAFESVIKDPQSIAQNVRKDVKLDEDSKLVVLSTCNPWELGHVGRYLVCGVLTSDVETR